MLHLCRKTFDIRSTARKRSCLRSDVVTRRRPPSPGSTFTWPMTQTRHPVPCPTWMYAPVLLNNCSYAVNVRGLKQQGVDLRTKGESKEAF
jgi:hypothetical protein